MNQVPTLVAIAGVKAQLSARMASDATSFAVETEGDLFPSSSFYVQIGDEVILVGTRSGNTFSSLTRVPKLRTGDTSHVHHRGTTVLYVVTGTALADSAPGSLGYAQRLVTVSLGAPGNFDIATTPDTVTAGTVTFLVSNDDALAITHEFLLIKTDDTAADLVAAAPLGGQFDESGYDVVIDSGDIAQGGSFRADVDLAAGHYVAVCNEAGHTHSGMAADFTVTASGGSISLTNVVSLELDPVVFFTTQVPPYEILNFEWQTVYDRDQNEIAEIPAAMGLHLGTSAFVPDVPVIIVDEPGMWSFELMANPSADPTAAVDIVMSIPGIFTGGPRLMRKLADWDGLTFNTTPEICLFSLASLVAGNEITVAAGTAAATADPYNVIDYAALQITRLT